MKILFILFSVFLSACSSANNQGTAELTKPILFTVDADKLSVPVRIHILSSQNTSDLKAKISLSETESVFDIVNLIWRQAGINFEVESVVSLPASSEVQYRTVVKSNSTQKMQVMRDVCDIPEQSKGVLNLCIVGKMSNSSGGVYFSGAIPKVVWPIVLRNGKKPLNPATLAHEFGHFLGLKHNTEKDIYLMAGRGNNMRRDKSFNRILLTENEIIKAREIVTKLFH